MKKIILFIIFFTLPILPAHRLTQINKHIRTNPRKGMYKKLLLLFIKDIGMENNPYSNEILEEFSNEEDVSKSIFDVMRYKLIKKSGIITMEKCSAILFLLTMNILLIILLFMKVAIPLCFFF